MFQKVFTFPTTKREPWHGVWLVQQNAFPIGNEGNCIYCCICLFAYYYRPTDCSWIVPVIILLLYVIPKILYYTNKRKEYWMICLIITSTLGFYITNYSTYWNSLLGSIFRFILQHEGEEVRDAYYAKQEYYYVIIVSAIQFLLGL